MPHRELEVQIEGSYPLSGTLVTPEGEQERYPIIIMVHGSGELDRDENNVDLKINAFKELSDWAADHGFATLRYDKRGIGKSKGEYYETGFYDLVDDVVSVVQFAKQQAQVDANRVILLGHSEGCLIAPLVNQRTSIQGMILLAGSAEPLTETMARQNQQMIEDVQKTRGFGGLMLKLFRFKSKYTKMNRDMTRKIMESDKPVIKYKGRLVNAKWHREHAGYDVREYLREVACPVLAISGTKDAQIKPEQVHEICQLVQGPCEAHLIQDMTHMLRKTDAEYGYNKLYEEYQKQLQKPVDQELKDMMLEWLQKWKTGEFHHHLEEGK